MRNKRLYEYKKYLDAFGWYYGMKVIIMGWISHFMRERKVYRINSKVGVTFLRRNSSDAWLARDLVGWEGGEYDFLKDIKAIESSKCIIDAGANIGLFSMLAREIAPKARLIAIEPDENNYRMCLRNIRLKEKDEILHAALWNKTSKLRIKDRGTGDVGFIVYEDKDGSIDAISMEEIIRQYNVESIDLLKIDIEGSEYEVFDETVEDWIGMVKVLIIELHDRIKPGSEERVRTVMEKHNYTHRKYGEYDVFERKNR